MFQCKPIFMGNPDHGQYFAPVKPKTFTADDIYALRRKVREFLDENDLGAGNWDTCKVFKDGKPYGFMSYNGKIWDKEYWSIQAKEIS